MQQIIQSNVDAIQDSIVNAESAADLIEEAGVRDDAKAALASLHEFAKNTFDSFKAAHPELLGGVALRSGGNKPEDPAAPGGEGEGDGGEG